MYRTNFNINQSSEHDVMQDNFLSRLIHCLPCIKRNYYSVVVLAIHKLALHKNLFLTGSRTAGNLYIIPT